VFASSHSTVPMTNRAPATYHHRFTPSWCHGRARPATRNQCP
jgi:hypothetical protein